MSNYAILNLLERVLGRSKKNTNANYSFVCPFHVSSSGKYKLEVNINTGQWQCWSCSNTNNTKGKTIDTLFKKLQVTKDKFDELKLLVPSTKYHQHTKVAGTIELPKEFLPIITNIHVGNRRSLQSIAAHKAFNYLEKRNISIDDIIKYNIGYCWEGKYENRIIIPSYDENAQLNYFIARDFTDSAYQKYDNPAISLKNIVGLELFINWNLPIVIVEGMFDALAFRRNCIPLFGKVLHQDGLLIKKILVSKCKKVYLALDRDALKDSIKTCENLLKQGIEVYLVDMKSKDVSEMGFEHFLEVIENTQPLTFSSLIQKKLEMI